MVSVTRIGNETESFRLQVGPPSKGPLKHRWLDIGDCLEGEFVAGQLVGVVVPSLSSLFDEQTGRYLVEYFGAGETLDRDFGPFEYHGREFTLQGLLEYLYGG